MPAEWKTKANHEHGHVDVIDENGKHVHVIDAKGNVLTEQQIEKAKQDVIAAKAAEARKAYFNALAARESMLAAEAQQQQAQAAGEPSPIITQ